MDGFYLLAVQGTLKNLLQHHSSKASILQRSDFFTVQFSHPYMATGKTIALTRRTFVGKVMSLLFNMLSGLVTTFLLSSKRLLISCLQSPSAVININCLCINCLFVKGQPHIAVGKEPTCNAGDPGLIPVLGRSAGEGIGYPLQCSWASFMAQLAKNPPAMRETWVQSLGYEEPLEKGKVTNCSIQFIC